MPTLQSYTASVFLSFPDRDDLLNRRRSIYFESINFEITASAFIYDKNYILTIMEDIARNGVSMPPENNDE